MRAARARLTVLLACRRDFLVFLPVGAGLVVFVAGFSTVLGGLEEAGTAGAEAGWPEDCAVISAESRTARQREACRRMEIGDDPTLISSL